MSKDIPIIFSGPMVRALLEGRKTQTRRILACGIPTAPGIDNVNPANNIRHDLPYFDAYCSERKSPENPRGMSRNWCWWTRDDRQCLPTVNVKYAPGDRLWVREAWQLHSLATDVGTVVYRASINDSWTEAHELVPVAKIVGKKVAPKPFQMGWRSPLHLFREFSRVTLIVTGVKVERLQDISDADALAEGVLAWRDSWTEKQAAEAFLRGTEAAAETRQGTVAQRLFYLLWTSLHGREEWTKNPFVVAPTFRVIKANIDAPEARAAA